MEKSHPARHRLKEAGHENPIAPRTLESLLLFAEEFPVG
jgi:hypothetical protein